VVRCRVSAAEERCCDNDQERLNRCR